MQGKATRFKENVYLCKQKQDKDRDMATIVLQVPDESLVAKVKQACKMLIGVTSVKTSEEPFS